MFNIFIGANQCLSQDWQIFQFTSYQFFFTVIKPKDQLFVRGIWGDEMREKARKSAV